MATLDRCWSAQGTQMESQASAGAQLRSLSAAHQQQISSKPIYQSLKQFSHTTELYKGSVSTVLRGVEDASGRHVVIKVYHKQKMQEKHYHKLQREVEAMYAMQGEAVVELLGTFQDTDAIYLIMEWCEGGDLFKKMMMSGGHLDPHYVCVEIIAPLLRVLDRMHCATIMHRDIKPENIFLSASGRLRLGDFGLAVNHTQELPFSRSGTLDYMAPEVLKNPATSLQEGPGVTPKQLEGKRISPYGPGVDVWAAGVLAYELICGRPPFEVADESQTASLIMYSNTIRFPPQHDPAWADFVRQALTKDPQQRPCAAALLAHPWMHQHHHQAGHAKPRASAANTLAPMALSPALLEGDGIVSVVSASKGGGTASKAGTKPQQAPGSPLSPYLMSPLAHAASVPMCPASAPPASSAHSKPRPLSGNTTPPPSAKQQVPHSPVQQQAVHYGAPIRPAGAASVPPKAAAAAVGPSSTFRSSAGGMHQQASAAASGLASPSSPRYAPLQAQVPVTAPPAGSHPIMHAATGHAGHYAPSPAARSLMGAFAATGASLPHSSSSSRAASGAGAGSAGGASAAAAAAASSCTPATTMRSRSPARAMTHARTAATTGAGSTPSLSPMASPQPSISLPGAHPTSAFACGALMQSLERAAAATQSEPGAAAGPAPALASLLRPSSSNTPGSRISNSAGTPKTATPGEFSFPDDLVAFGAVAALKITPTAGAAAAGDKLLGLQGQGGVGDKATAVARAAAHLPPSPQSPAPGGGGMMRLSLPASPSGAPGSPLSSCGGASTLGGFGETPRPQGIKERTKFFLRAQAMGTKLTGQ